MDAITRRSGSSSASPRGDPRFFACSGALIAPRVFLTAGHCTDFLATSGLPTVVSFDPTFQPGKSVGIPVVDLVTHPDFNENTSIDDLGVAVLRRTVRGLTPVSLPPLGFLDQLQAQGQFPSALSVLGYGSVEQCGGTGPCTLQFGLIRRIASVAVTGPFTRSGSTCRTIAPRVASVASASRTPAGPISCLEPP
jgi:Trypsin